MGFFKNIFKGKKGGTFVGNLIRGVASTATGGILGSGKQLEKKDAQRAAKEVQKQLQNSAGYQTGTAVVDNTPELQIMRQISETEIAKKGGMAVAKEWLKKYWYYVVGGVVVLVVIVWGIPKLFKKSDRR